MRMVKLILRVFGYVLGMAACVALVFWAFAYAWPWYIKWVVAQ